MDPAARVEDYYNALREGEPLAPFFADRQTTVKFGIWETLEGGEAVADGLAEQTETTSDWTVDSRNLTVDSHGETAWFADDVFLAWTDTGQRIRYEFDTRWSGTLVDDGEWQFVGMHVSRAGDR